MFKFIKNYRRAKALIREDDKRIELERLKKMKAEKIREEIANLTDVDIAYIQSLTEININKKDCNLATLYREFNRVKLSLFTLIPTTYLEIFNEKPPIVFDSVYIRNAELTSYQHSLSEIEQLFANSAKKENWPPEKIYLDNFDEACYYTFHNSLGKGIVGLKKLLSLINSYS